MLDKYTFGRTPAALYLVEHLNILNQAKLTRKISAKLTEHRAILRELEEANTQGIISLKTLGSLAETINHRVRERKITLAAENQLDTLALHLMTNLMIGDVKSLLRRSQRAITLTRIGAHTKQPESKNESNGELITADGYVVGVREASGDVRGFKFTAGETHDDITPELLAEKSRRNLKRRGKRCELY